MFRELALGGILEENVVLQCPKTRRAWERRKLSMEKASRWTWETRTNQLRESTLKELWDIFVDDSPFGEDSLLKQVNVHSKAVFSYALTLMDKIRGWEDEESWVGSKFAACLWEDTQDAWTKGPN